MAGKDCATLKDSITELIGIVSDTDQDQDFIAEGLAGWHPRPFLASLPLKE